MIKLNKALIISGLVLISVLFATNMFAQGNKIEFKEEVLSNGLEVIYHVDRSAPVVATVLHYKVGSKDEVDGRTGFAHFFEHLMFEATDNYERSVIDKYINGAGGNLNAHTSFDETVYQFRLPSNYAELPLWIESSRMRFLQVEETGVETQRGVVKEERKVRYENAPYGDLFDRIVENLFPKSPYSWTPIGSPEDINSASIEEFKKFYNNFYQPNNAVLVISGDFNLNAAKDWVKKYFGAYEKAAEPVRRPFSMPDMAGEVRQEIEDDKAQVHLKMMAWRGPTIGHNDSYALELLSEIMSAGESSRIYKKLVDDEQSALSAGMSFLPMEKAGVIFAQLIPNGEKNIKSAEKHLLSEIEKVIKKGVTEEELTKAKNIKETEMVMSNKDALQKAYKLAKYKAYLNDASLINTEINKYLAVTKDDIMRVAKQYLDTENRVVLLYSPKSVN